MLTSRHNDQLYLIGVREQAAADDCTQVTFSTTRGDVTAYARHTRGSRKAVILLGTDSPDAVADSELGDICRQLAQHGIGSVRLDYRFPGDRAQCAIDALLVCQYLDDEGVNEVLLVGWSFGAAVALAAGSVGRTVRGVAAIHPPDVPECCIQWMGGKPLLLMNGKGGSICPHPTHVRNLTPTRPYSRAELIDWILRTFGAAASPADQAITAGR